MKYLIDKQMYDAIVWMLPDATPIKEMVSALKPIEPLSKMDISRLASAALNDTTDRFPNEVLARAIEAHILGEKHDS